MSRAVHLAGDDDEGLVAGLVFHRGVVDEIFLPAGDVDGVAAFFFDEEVADADVGEGSAHHDFVAAAARAVEVEVLFLDAVGDEVRAGRAFDGDVAGGGDVVFGVRRRCRRFPTARHVAPPQSADTVRAVQTENADGVGPPTGRRRNKKCRKLTARDAGDDARITISNHWKNMSRKFPCDGNYRH